MGLIVDTGILIKAEKQGSLYNFERWREESIYISSITASELLVGVHRANSTARRLKRIAFVDNVLANMPVLDFTLDVARVHSEIYAYLANSGVLIGSHDLLIAATAVAHDFALLTDNVKEFERVPGLKLKN